MKFNVIIPMAGEGIRFGGTFKPFIKVDDRTMVEHVLDSFCDNDIIKYYFIITEEQETIYKICNKFKLLLPTIIEKVEVYIIKHKTHGPYQTIVEFIRNKYLENILVCDCDHKLNIGPLIDTIKLNTSIIPDIILSSYDLTNKCETNNLEIYNQENWCKFTFKNNKIQQYFDKEIVTFDDMTEIYGIIGCYYFKNSLTLEINNEYLYFTQFFKNNIKLEVKICKIVEFYPFGTPKLLLGYIEQKRNCENIICDIDGVLFKHTPNSNTAFDDNIVLNDCRNKLILWKSQHKKIFLMTARSKTTRNELITLLNNKGIYFDELIMGVNPGTRYVINDIKPSHIFTKQAVPINRIRDTGIDDVECNEYLNNQIEIIQILKGGSFSTNYLIRKNKYKYVRKYIIKTGRNMEHYLRLKRQSDDLKRFYYYDNKLVPQILYENDNNFDYYFDMEYFENYNQLTCFSKQVQEETIIQIIKRLDTNIYCFKKQLNETEKHKFMDDYFNEKIYCKLNTFEKTSSIMKYLINENEVTINNIKYLGLKSIFKKLNVYNYAPNFICPIHGDLNFENILYNDETADFKLIDMEGSRYVDTPLFDLGKLFQSMVSNYEEWSILDTVIFNNNENNLLCVDKYFDFNKDKVAFITDVFSKILKVEDSNTISCLGIFYMANYFIRFIPFRIQVSEEHGIFAMIMAVVWLNNILYILNDE